MNNLIEKAKALINAIDKSRIELWKPDLSESVSCITLHPESALPEVDADEKERVTTEGIETELSLLENSLKDAKQDMTNILLAGCYIFTSVMEADNSSFFSNADQALEIAEEFCKKYENKEKRRNGKSWSPAGDWESALYRFATKKLKKG